MMEYSTPVSTPLGKQSKITLNSRPLEIQTAIMTIASVTDKEIGVEVIPEELSEFLDSVGEHNKDWYLDQKPKRTHTHMDPRTSNGVFFRIKGYTRWYTNSGGKMHAATTQSARVGDRIVLKIHAPYAWLTKNKYGAVWYIQEVCVLTE